jgi:hypothetical protein
MQLFAFLEMKLKTQFQVSTLGREFTVLYTVQFRKIEYRTSAFRKVFVPASATGVEIMEYPA